MSSLSIKVTAWNNGKHHDSGAGYGLKLAADDRDRLFDRAWQTVFLILPDDRGEIEVNVAKRSFWGGTCRELIKHEIGLWLRDTHAAPWTAGRPPTFTLERIGERRFRLS